MSAGMDGREGYAGVGNEVLSRRRGWDWEAEAEQGEVRCEMGREEINWAETC